MPNSMTKKHYIAIAKVINSLCFYIPSLCTEERERIARLLSDKIGKFNPLYDKDKFIAACTKDEERKM